MLGNITNDIYQCLKLLNLFNNLNSTFAFNALKRDITIKYTITT